MSTEPDANRFAPPTAAVADVATVTPAGTLAGRGTRLVAAIVDGLIILAVVGLLAWLTPLNVFVPGDAAATGNLLWLTLRNLALFLVLYLAINGYLLHLRGQTVGKSLMKIRIVRSDGSRATLLRLFGLRYVVNGIISSLPLVGGLYALVDSLMIFRDSHKCVHDNIADTVVVTA